MNYPRRTHDDPRTDLDHGIEFEAGRRRRERVVRQFVDADGQAIEARRDTVEPDLGFAIALDDAVHVAREMQQIERGLEVARLAAQQDAPHQDDPVIAARIASGSTMRPIAA